MHAVPGPPPVLRRTARSHVVAASATTALAASLGAGTWFGWELPVALVAGAVALGLTCAWIGWIVRRDVRAVIALWLVFALLPTTALLVPSALAERTLWLDDIALAATLAVLLLSGARLVPSTRGMTVAYIGLGVFAVSGIVGSLMATSGITVTGGLGTWLGLKLLVCLVVAEQFRWEESGIRLAARVAAGVIVLVVSVAAVQWVAPEAVNAVFDVRQHTRLGITALTSIFRNPAQHNTFMLFALALALARFPQTPRRIAQTVVVAAGALLSLRLKALVEVVAVVTARVAVSPDRRMRAAAPLTMLGGITAGALVGAALISNQIGVLFGSGTESPRQVLYATSTRIAGDFFPLGGGFGSFGSKASLLPYSPLYSRYGLSDTYGFSEDRPIFIHDASWATVLGETGVIGLGGFAVGLGALVLSAWQRARIARATLDGDVARAALLFALVVTADSFTTPQLFTGFACMTLAILLTMRSPVRSATSSVPGHPAEVSPVPGGER